MALTILYISYWGIDDGLTKATVIPHLNILASFEGVNKIIFISIERETVPSNFIHKKLKHIPFQSNRYKSILLTKVLDFTFLQKKLNKICTREKIDFVICRSSLAGIFGDKLLNKFSIPYIVESFEPHREYMIEAGVWNKYGIRSLIQRRAEKNQLKRASFIIPVSNKYSQRLLKEGVDKRKILTLACCVSLEEFAFNPEIRIQKRKELKIGEDELVGIYVGKYGDIYHTDKAYALYRDAFSFFRDKFRLIILTFDDHEVLKSRLMNHNVPINKVFIANVPHSEVSSFLSSADFAFSTIKPTPAREYCSPIKNGEYWANGLPILMEPGIGEDSDIVQSEGGGVLLDLNNAQKAFILLLEKYLSRNRSEVALEIQNIANKHRGMENVHSTYKTIISRLGFSSD